MVTIVELTHGVQRAGTEERRRRRQAFVDELVRDMPVHPVTIETARLAGRIGGDQASQGVTIAFEDLLIAATALQLEFGVVTGNVRHFEQIRSAIRVFSNMRFRAAWGCWRVAASRGEPTMYPLFIGRSGINLIWWKKQNFMNATERSLKRRALWDQTGDTFPDFGRVTSPLLLLGSSLQHTDHACQAESRNPEGYGESYSSHQKQS